MPPVVNIRSLVTGERHGVTPEEAARILRAEPASWTIESPEETAAATVAAQRHADYSGATDKAGALFGQAANIVSLGGSDVALGALGSQENIERARAMREENPGYTTAGTALGIVTSLATGGEGALGAAARLTPAAQAGRIGRALAETAIPRAVGAELTAGARIGRGVISGGVEAGLFNAGAGVSDLALSDDPITMDRAAGELSTRFYAGATDPLAAPIGGVLGATEHLLLRQSRRLTELKAAAKKAEETATPGAVIPEDIAGMDIADAKAAQKAEHARIEAEDLTPQRQALISEVQDWRVATKETRPWDALATGSKAERDAAKVASVKAEKAAKKAEKDAAALAAKAKGETTASGARQAEAKATGAQLVDQDGNPALTWREFNTGERMKAAMGETGSMAAAHKKVGADWQAYKATLRKGEARTPFAPPSYASLGDNVVEQTVPARELAGKVRASSVDNAVLAEGEPISLAVRGDGSLEATGGSRELLAAMDGNALVKVRIARGAEEAVNDGTTLLGEHLVNPARRTAQEAAEKAAEAAKAARRAANDAAAAYDAAAARMRERAPDWVREGGRQYMNADKKIDTLLNNMEGLAEMDHNGPGLRNQLRGALQTQRQILQRMTDRADELRKMHALDKTTRRADALAAVNDTLARNKALQARLDALAAPHASPRLDALAAHIDMISTPKAPPTLAAKIKAAGAYAGVSAIGHAILPGVADFAIAPVAALAAAKVLGEKSGRTLQAAIRASAERTSKAVDLLLSANRTARKVAPKLVPLASKVLANTRFFGGGSPEPARGKQDLHDLFRARSEEIAQMVEPGPNGPQVKRVVRDMIATLLSPLMQVAPHVADGLETRAVKRILFLDSKRPRATQIGMTTIPPSEMAIRAFARYVAAADDPSAVEERVAHGIVTPEDRETMKALYPDRMADYVRQVVERLPELRATLPYQKRLALSQYTGAAIDASMDPRIVGQLQAGHRKEKGTEGGTKAPVPMPAFGSVKKPDPTPAQKRAG